jgi:pre-mRNA-splicing helicase BRR2
LSVAIIKHWLILGILSTSLEVSHEVRNPGELTASAPITVSVTLERELDEGDIERQDFTVMAPFFPMKKTENWWVVIGETSTRQLLSIKKIPLRSRRHAVNLDFTLPKGEHQLTLFTISDSYAGVDQEESFVVTVAEGEESESEEESEADEDGDVAMQG